MANFRICSIPDCGKPHKVKGYCEAHYRRLMKHGDPLGGPTPRGELLRFIHEVAMQHTGTGCLTWPYGKGRGGYGQLRLKGKSIEAHRYVCILANGTPPTPEHDAAHSCGKGHEGCIAPGHLEWKTRAENKADELLHGTRPRGERHGNAKLTEASVREIIDLKGKEKQRDLAERFLVSRPLVANIQAGRKWAWLSKEDAA